VRLALLCNIIFALVAISASQESRSVRQVVAEATRLGIILEGQCPSVASGSGVASTSGSLSGSAVASGFSTSGTLPPVTSGSASGTPTGSASGSASGSGSGSVFSCATVDVRVQAFCAVAFREQLCSFAMLSTDTCNLCTSLSNICGPFSGSVDTVCDDGLSLLACSVLPVVCSTSQQNPSLSFQCDFCRFVRQRCVSSASGSSASGSSASGSSASGISASGISASGTPSGSASGFPGSGSGSSFSCATVDVRFQAFCAVAFREQLCSQAMLSTDTCNICTSLSNLCGPFSGSVDTVCDDGRSLSACSAALPMVCSTSLQNPQSSFQCDFCRFVQQRCNSSASGIGSGTVLSRRRRQTVVTSASGMSASGSGSGDVCSNTDQVLGPLCANVLQARLCEYNFTSQTCDVCNNLLSTCGPPGGQGDLNTLCSSQSALACGPLTRSCFEDQTVLPATCDFCTFVGNTCFQLNEVALCAVDGLVDGCTNLLNFPYQCECFSPSSTCQLCRTVLPVCSTPATIPVSLNNLVTSELIRYDTQHQILS